MDIELANTYCEKANSFELINDYNSAFSHYLRALEILIEHLYENCDVSDRLRHTVFYNAQTCLARVQFLNNSDKQCKDEDVLPYECKSLPLHIEAECIPNPTIADDGCSGNSAKKVNRAQGSSNSHLNEIKEQLLSQVVSEKPDTTWESIVGVEDAKQGLREAILVPKMFPISGQASNAWNGILLFEPGGVGKTSLAKAVAAEADLTFINVKLDAITSKWLGDSEKAIADLFLISRERAPCIMFIYEIDALCGDRNREDENSSSLRVKTKILTEMDGLDSAGQGRVIVIGATNLPFRMDPSFLRRFPKRVFVGLPGVDERRRILTNSLAKYSYSLNDSNIKAVAKFTERFSPADLDTLVTSAGMVQIKPILQSSGIGQNQRVAQLRPITKDDFVTARRQVKPTNKGSNLTGLKKFNKDFGDGKDLQSESTGNRKSCCDCLISGLGGLLACITCQ